MKNTKKVLLAAQVAALLMAGCGNGAAAPAAGGDTAQTAPAAQTAEETAQTEAEPAAEAPAEDAGAAAAEGTEEASAESAGGSAGSAYEDPNALPAYAYQGTEEFMDVISDYLASDAKANGGSDEANVYIPYGSIVMVDKSNPEDILAYGTFGSDGYQLLNTTLVSVTGSRGSGVFHLKKNEDGTATITKAELPETEEDSIGLFEAVAGLYDQVIQENDKIDALREQAIADYVNANGLNITQWQDYGHAPKAVLNAPPTADADQLYTAESPLGYKLTYDLREYSLSRTSGEDMYGKIEPEDVWTGTLMVVNKWPGYTADDAIAEVLSFTGAADLKSDDAAIGNGIACKRAAYDEKLDDGRIFRYVCYAVPAGNDIITVLIETTVEKGVSELSAEELEKTFEGMLSSFTLL